MEKNTDRLRKILQEDVKELKYYRSELIKKPHMIPRLKEIIENHVEHLEANIEKLKKEITKKENRWKQYLPYC